MFAKKKPKIFIHAGGHKTGTTALQNFFDINYDLLRKQGVLYPKNIRYAMPGAKFAHHALAFHLGFGQERRFLNEIKEKVKNNAYSFHDELTNEIRESKADLVLLSSEAFSVFGSNENLEKLLKLLHNYDVHLLYYVRKHDELVESIYRFQVGQGINCKPIEEYIEDFISSDSQNYYKILNAFSEILPRQNMHVRLYEFKNRSDIFNDVSEVLGIRQEVEFAYPGTLKSNVSLNNDFLKVMIHFNRECDKELSRKLKVILRRVQEESRSNFEKGTLLTHEQRKKILEHYKPTYSLIAREYLGRENGILFSDPDSF